MVSIRRQRLKAIRSGVPVEEANKSNSIQELINLMEMKNARIIKSGDVVQPGELVKMEVGTDELSDGLNPKN